MLTVLSKTTVIFSIMAVGFVANKSNIIPIEANKYFVNIMLLINTPCMILAGLTKFKLDDDAIETTFEVALGSLIFFIGAWMVSWVIIKIMNYNPKKDRGVMMVIMCAINSGFMGFPITKAIFGNRAFFFMVIANAMLSFYLYLIAVIQMRYGDGSKPDATELKRVATNPNIIATITGIGMLAVGIDLSDPAWEFINILGNMTVPLSMLVVGVQLATSDFTSIIKNGKLIAASLVNVLLMPALTLATVFFLPMTAEGKLVLVFSTAFPCAVITVAVAAKEGKNVTLMSQGVALTTLFSIITLPAAAVLLTKLYG